MCLSIVVPSYLEDGRVIMKACVQINPVYSKKKKRLSPPAGIRLGTARSFSQVHAH